ncbi:MAG: acetate--CoA ligase family protein [Chloroflexi bacterium]|nr:acetate--CoA ligase family protein [Chloroflexota bacterium]
MAELSALFEPRSVALIGASADPGSISARPLRLLQQHGFAGRLYPVNPKYHELRGLAVYPTIAAVPAPVDLALVVVPAPAVAGVLEECAAAGVRCAVVITSGFAESGLSGLHLQRQIADVVKRTALRVCGPNSEGVYNPANRLCATFSPAVDPEHGYVPVEGGPAAVVSQSGGLAFALLNHAQERGLAIGAVISTGNEVDLGWADYAEYLLDRPDIRVILGFVEAFRQPDRLVRIAHKAARLRKPMVIAKIGRSEAGRRAAASHTASLVGADAAHSAAFRQLGIMRVDDVDEMLDLAAYFSVGRLPPGRRVAVLTASGGAGAWLADACASRGLELPPPDTADQATIRSFIPAYGSVGNPVDITAQAVLEGGFERALGVLCASARFDVVAPVATLVREERFFETLRDLKDAIAGTSAAVAYYSYTRASPAVIAALTELGIPCFSTPGRTARALSAAAEYAEFLDRLDQVAVFQPIDRSGEWPPPAGALSEYSARMFLHPLAIHSPGECLASSAEEAVMSVEALGGGPVALKIQSPDLAHKTDVGGVRLGLRTVADVRSAFAELVEVAQRRHPAARIEGVLVQKMAPPGVEAFVAARREPLLGPLVLVGMGGVDVEVLGDVAIRLAPVSLAEAHVMVAELRGAALLGGTRGRPPADVEALARAVVRISVMAANLPPNVINVEINPLLVLAAGDGLLMLDAAIELQPTAAAEEAG